MDRGQNYIILENLQKTPLLISNKIKRNQAQQIKIDKCLKVVNTIYSLINHVNRHPQSHQLVRDLACVFVFYVFCAARDLTALLD